jgi:hypothetical protein
MRISQLERRSKRKPVRQYVSDSHDDRKTMADLKAAEAARKKRRDSARGDDHGDHHP